MKAVTAVRIAIATFVSAMFAFGLYRCTTGDYKDKPDQRELADEIAAIHQRLGGRLHYVQRGTWVGMYATSESAMDVSGVLRTDGWTEFPNGANSGKKLCKGRLALLMETTTHMGKSAIEYGIYWSSDRGSTFFCATDR